MTVGVKICGVNSPAAMTAAAGAGANWVGFVFHAPSPRAVTPADAAALAALAPDLPAVALFVAPDDAAVEAVLKHVAPHALQLHDVTAARAAALQARFDVPVWRAIGIGSAADLPRTADGADRLLLDAAPPAGATLPGGNARRFDWSVLRGWQAPAPWMLAGGLTPDNVAEAVRVTGTTAVDVSSGVESARGVKDPALIGRFVTAARLARRDVSPSS